jgi:hypothetical protein
MISLPVCLLNAWRKKSQCSYLHVGIQLKNISFDEGMSRGIKKVLTEITDLIKNARGEPIQEHQSTSPETLNPHHGYNSL